MPLIVFERHFHETWTELAPQHANKIDLLQTTMEKVMAQLDDLMTVLNAVHDDVTTVLAKAQALEAQLTQQQQTTPPQVDLQPAIDLATSIRQSLEGTASTTGDATGATPAPAPTDTSTAPADTTTTPPADSTTVSDAVSAEVVPASDPATQGTQTA